MVLLAGVLTSMGTARRARAQISPGPLSRAHQSLEGPLNCLKCHAGKAQAMEKACLECHKPIATLQALNRGLHATIKDQKCAACHPEHAGRDFSLIHWDGGAPEKFDHARAGFTLDGKHATTACRECHKPALQKAAFMSDVPAAHRPESWLGLERDCKSCHQDMHNGALAADCAGCHTTTAWKPVTRFDHAKSDFPLTGKHVKVVCIDCHKGTQAVTLAAGGTKTMAIFKPVVHAECSACHKDPHQTQLGPKCSTCHVTEDFHKVAGDRFNHDKTRYPLSGRHVSLTCAQCHDAVKAWGAKPAFDRCAACHKDPHAGEATLAGQKVDCASCHAVKGFTPSTFTVAQHEKSTYPLAGKHAAVACAACHLKATGKRAPNVGIVKLRPRFTACRDCHAESHARQLAARADQGACETCHTPQQWKPSRFGVPEHALLKLPLEGRHATIACADCHGPKRHDLPPLPGPEVLGKAGIWLALPGSACADCHVNVHKGTETPAAVAAPAPATRKGEARRTEARGGARKGEAKSNAGGEAKNATGPAIVGTCTNCHTLQSFRPSKVDVAAHRSYAFPLEGAHQAVSCEACHAALKRPAATPALLMAAPALAPLGFGKPAQLCADCHQGPHGTQFEGRASGSDCGRCHGLEAFAPADRFDHNRDAAFSLKGAHQNVVCGKCHPTQPVPGGKPRVLYRPVDARCESCHAKGSVKP